MPFGLPRVYLRRKLRLPDLCYTLSSTEKENQVNARSPAVPKPSFTSYAGPDRRRNRRYMGQDLACSVDSRPATVQDISEGGLRVAIGGVIAGQVVQIHLATPGAEPVKTTARVLAADGTKASLVFTAPTYALMKFVVQYLADHHGVSVHAFR